MPFCLVGNRDRLSALALDKHPLLSQHAQLIAEKCLMASVLRALHAYTIQSLNTKENIRIEEVGFQRNNVPYSYVSEACQLSLPEVPLAIMHILAHNQSIASNKSDPDKSPHLLLDAVLDQVEQVVECHWVQPPRILSYTTINNALKDYDDGEMQEGDLDEGTKEQMMIAEKALVQWIAKVDAACSLIEEQLNKLQASPLHAA